MDRDRLAQVDQVDQVDPVAPVTLLLAGDAMTGRGIDQVLAHPSSPRLYEPVLTSARDYVALAEQANGPVPRPMGPCQLWGAALAALERAHPDARIVNLETSVTTSEDATFKGINYRMHPENVPVLTAARIDCCTLANNHVLDWGMAGLLETLTVLAQAGIAVAGAGRDLAQARAPAVLAVRGARVLVFAFGSADSGIPPGWRAGRERPGVHLLPDLSEDTAADIGDLVGATKRPGDIAVASIHWGGNWGYDIPPAHRTFAHALIDRAAIDVVHGHSSHHPKAIEVYRDRPILYGCGDLVNDYEGISGYEAFRADLVLLYLPTVDAATGALVRFELVPMRIRNLGLRRASPDERAWVARRLDRECRRFGHRVCADAPGDALALAW
jgi:poly-gamma-glutamate synthesis protein (capsule biosynthesis protein)